MLAFGGCLHKFVGVGVHPLIPSACLKFSCSQLVEQFDDSIACTFISGKNGLDLRENDKYTIEDATNHSVNIFWSWELKIKNK